MRRKIIYFVPVIVALIWAAPPARGDEPGSFLEPVTVIHEVSIQAGRVFYGWAVSELRDIDADGVGDFVTGSILLDKRAGQADVFSGQTGTPIFSFFGEPGDLLSYSVADAGDATGDAVSDLLIGAPGNGAGHVDLRSGATGELVHRFHGEIAGDFFGSAVASAGDVNLDGRADVLIGAARNDAPGVDAGRAYIYSGADHSLIRTLDGTVPGDFFGTATDWTQDLNGDAVPDQIVGARHAGSGRAGEISVFSGNDGHRVWVAGPDPSGVDLGYFFAAGVGDVNGDGTPDVYGGDFNDSALGAGTGRAYVFSGVDGTIILRFPGLVGGEGLGPGREAGDVDADGRPDLIVGSFLSSDGAPRAGKVRIFSGADGSLLRTITSTRGGENLGFDAVGLGDVNRDGIPDALISAANRNTLYVVAGVKPEH
jgi:hypothetical protein